VFLSSDACTSVWEWLLVINNKTSVITPGTTQSFRTRTIYGPPLLPRHNKTPWQYTHCFHLGLESGIFWTPFCSSFLIRTWSKWGRHWWVQEVVREIEEEYYIIFFMVYDKIFYIIISIFFLDLETEKTVCDNHDGFCLLLCFNFFLVLWYRRELKNIKLNIYFFDCQKKYSDLLLLFICLLVCFISKPLIFLFTEQGTRTVLLGCDTGSFPLKCLIKVGTTAEEQKTFDCEDYTELIHFVLCLYLQGYEVRKITAIDQDLGRPRGIGYTIISGLSLIINLTSTAQSWESITSYHNSAAIIDKTHQAQQSITTASRAQNWRIGLTVSGY